MRVLQGNEELLERKGWDGMNSGRGIERARPAPQIIERAKRVLVAAGASRSETLTTRQARRQYAQPPFFLPPFAPFCLAVLALSVQWSKPGPDDPLMANYQIISRYQIV
jgi:hypothetical protein